MTMCITMDQKIGGVPSTDVRDILKRLHIDESFNPEWIAEELYWLRVKDIYDVRETRQDCLRWLTWPDEDRRRYRQYYPDCLRQWNTSRRTSASVIKTLVADGFIELYKEGTECAEVPQYKLTESGVEFCRATVAEPVHRKSAEEALRGLIERVHVVNEDDRFLYRVTAVVLYGSYLRGAERPADLAIEMERKIADAQKFYEACQKRLHDSGRASQDVYDFARHEVFVFLRQRKRALSLHRIHDFIGMKLRDNISYEVLFGDKDKMAKRLRVEYFMPMPEV